MANAWKTLSSKVIYKNNYFQVKEDKVIRPNGKNGDYFVVDIAPSVMIVPLSEKREIYLVGQYRYTSGEFSWEIPGGTIESKGILNSAKRELREETGLTSRDWQSLGSLKVLNSNTNEQCHVFLAKNVVLNEKNEQLEEGIVKMEKFPIDKILKMVDENQITDSETLSALFLAFTKLKLFTK